jgi:hypothetical protein
MKKIIYTVLLGDYKLREPRYKNNDWKFVCFTDQDIKSKSWNIVKVDGGRKKSREIKICSHRFMKYDLCVYIDAKFTVKINLDDFVGKNLGSDLSLMKHNKRNCLYDEGNFCIKIGKDKKETILKQLNYYEKKKMPKNFGLYAPGIMIKRNTKEVNDFMDLWYKQVDKFSYRDIISFSYTLWKNPIDLTLMPFKETYRNFREIL